MIFFPAPCHACFCCSCGLPDPRAWCRRYVCLTVYVLLLFQRSAYPSQCMWMLCVKNRSSTAFMELGLNIMSLEVAPILVFSNSISPTVLIWISCEFVRWEGYQRHSFAVGWLAFLLLVIFCLLLLLVPFYSYNQ
jgi:hypothetical protein